MTIHLLAHSATHLGTLLDGLGSSPLDPGASPPESGQASLFSGVRRLDGLRKALGHRHPHSALLPGIASYLCYLDSFRGEPAISELDRPFTPYHPSSENLVTFNRAGLQAPVGALHPGDGKLAWFRVIQQR